MSETERSQSRETTPGGRGPDPKISGVASFIVPGAGHFFLNDQTKRGAIVFGITILLDIFLFIASSLVAILTFGLGLMFYLMIPVVHLASAYDAYKQAIQINSGQV